MASGRRQVGGFYYAGDLIGLEAGPAHRFSAEAVCPAIVLVVRAASLKALSGDSALDRAIWEATRRELERAQHHLMRLGRKNAYEKVASFLMDLAQYSAGDRAVQVPMSRQDMADYLGLTIETVSRMLTQLQDENAVSFNGTRTFDVKHWRTLEDLAA
jgi:CRP/FNR family nitrogen fixation transcriptional regulator